MNAQELLVAHETSLLVRTGCGSALWYESVKWSFEQMRGLSSNLDTLYSV